MEGRDQPDRTQSRVALPSNLERVNAAAKQAAKTRFTALLHHIDEDALLRAFRRQKRQASAGGDGGNGGEVRRGAHGSPGRSHHRDPLGSSRTTQRKSPKISMTPQLAAAVWSLKARD